MDCFTLRPPSTIHQRLLDAVACCVRFLPTCALLMTSSHSLVSCCWHHLPPLSSRPTHEAARSQCLHPGTVLQPSVYGQFRSIPSSVTALASERTCCKRLLRRRNQRSVFRKGEEGGEKERKREKGIFIKGGTLYRSWLIDRDFTDPVWAVEAICETYASNKYSFLGQRAVVEKE